MPFGLRNASQTFQRFIDSVLRGLDFCCAYVDDIVIVSKTEEEHIQHMEEVFRRLDEHGLVVNADKCCFGNAFNRVNRPRHGMKAWHAFKALLKVFFNFTNTALIPADWR